jgi:hypothetical protein
MKILVAQATPSASVHYRVDEPVRAVRAAGVGIDIEVTRGFPTTMLPSSDGEPLVGDVDTGDADLVVLQLPKTSEMLQVLRILQARGIAVAVEIDDLMSAAPAGHMGQDPARRARMARFALECGREADLVTTTTPALLEAYAPHGRGAVVPNAIPRRIAELPPAYDRSPDLVTVGWTGNVQGHLYDLQEVGSGLRQALDRNQGRSRMVVLGQKWDARERLGLPLEPAEIPWVPDVDGYLRLLGEAIDVGIAPLRLDRFNECKSWLKPLEYSARGVFCVRARTSEYERLGVGLPAKSPKDWAKWIAVGIEDADRRRELAAAAREQVLAQHLTEHRVEQWIGAWRSALENRAGSRAGVVGAGV